VTPSLITTPAPILPVVARVSPSICLKYPEICPGQNATTAFGFMVLFRVIYNDRVFLQIKESRQGILVF
jgi:hypothetical protein